MECRVCGFENNRRTHRVLIDSVAMLVCGRCSSVGRRLGEVKQQLTIESYFDMLELAEDPKRIKQARERLGLTRAKLADAWLSAFPCEEVRSGYPSYRMSGL